MVYCAQITIVHGGESKPSYNWGGHTVQMVNVHEFSIYYVSLLEGTAGYPQTFEQKLLVSLCLFKDGQTNLMSITWSLPHVLT